MGREEKRRKGDRAETEERKWGMGHVEGRRQEWEKREGTGRMGRSMQEETCGPNFSVIGIYCHQMWAENPQLTAIWTKFGDNRVLNPFTNLVQILHTSINICV